MREPGLSWVIPMGIDRLIKVNTQIVTLPIPSQKIITRDNVSIDVAAVAYYRVTDAIKSVVTSGGSHRGGGTDSAATVRNTIGQFMLDQVLSRDGGHQRQAQRDHRRSDRGVGRGGHPGQLKDITLPESMQRAMAKEAEAEREKRAKIIAAEGEFLAAERLGQAADVMMAHPIALQLRNLQTLVEISAEKNSTIIFPSQFFSSFQDMKRFITDETQAPKT